MRHSRLAKIMMLMGGGANVSTLTLQPDGATGIDAELRSTEADTNKGTVPDMRLRDSGSIVIKFDLSTLAGLTIVSANLYLTVTSFIGVNVNNVYRILPANSAWGELVATWNNADKDTPVAWAGNATAKGCSVSGTDYSSTLMGTFTNGATDANGTVYEIALNATEFALMVANNAGMIINSPTGKNSNYYGASNNSTESNRPKLVVNYF